MTDFSSLLKAIGLSSSETKVYLAALTHGPSTVLDLAKRANLSRPATYDAIESLTKKGAISSFLHGKRSRYTAESPERLLALAESESRKMSSTLREFADAMGDLKLLQGGERPTVKFFEGVEGLRAIAEDLIATNPERTEEIANLDAVKEIFSGEELKRIQNVLIKLKARGRALLGGVTPVARVGVEARVLPSEYKFYGDLVIYGNKVALITFKGKLIGVVIENPVIADTMRALFDVAWRSAKEFPVAATAAARN